MSFLDAYRQRLRNGCCVSWRLSSILLVVAAGCGEFDLGELGLPTAEPGSTPPAASASSGQAVNIAQEAIHDTPESAVHAFLSASRDGDLASVNQLLTQRAREATAALEIAVAPPASPHAEFEVTGHEFTDADGLYAQVASWWSDVGTDGQRTKSPIVWVVRREPAGWRVAGMIAQLVEDGPAEALNYEEPGEMIRKMQAAAAPAARRTASKTGPHGGGAPEKGGSETVIGGP